MSTSAMSLSDSKSQPSSRVAVLSALFLTSAMVFTTGCASKNYVRSQTTPLIQQTNDLDAKTASDHRAIADTDERAEGSANFAGILMGARPLTGGSSCGGCSFPEPHIFGRDSSHDLSRGRQPFANRRRARIPARSG